MEIDDSLYRYVRSVYFQYLSKSWFVFGCSSVRVSKEGNCKEQLLESTQLIYYLA